MTSAAEIAVHGRVTRCDVRADVRIGDRRVGLDEISIAWRDLAHTDFGDAWRRAIGVMSNPTSAWTPPDWRPLITWDSLNLVWAAGFFVECGYFTTHGSGPSLWAGVNDRRMLRRFAAIFALPVYGPREDGQFGGMAKHGGTGQWYTSTGSTASSFRISDELLPYLAGTKKEKEIIDRCVEFGHKPLTRKDRLL